MKLTILGSGTSQGIPEIGCSCPVCTSSDNRDKRMRSSLYIEGSSGERAVIDTGPEFRLQALKAGIKSLDAVFLTHAHADHIHGLDDLRPLSWQQPIPIFGSDNTIAEFLERFCYIFKDTQRGGGKPHIEPAAVNRSVQLGSLVFTPIPIKHGNLSIFGWKITEYHGSKKPISAVYLTDCSHIDEHAYSLIAEDGPPGLAIIGGLRQRPHATHFTFEQGLNAGIKTGAKQILLTHICHDYSHRGIEQYCINFARKAGLTNAMGPAWDGLELVL